MKKLALLAVGMIALSGQAQASQNSIVFNTATGAVLSGRDLVNGINGANNTIASHFSGTAAPSSPVSYQAWFDTSASPSNFKLYDGASWVSIGTLNTSTHTWTPAGAGGSMVYPGAGIAVSTGSAWGTSLSVIPVASGGTNASSAGGTALDNISGFASTGFLTRTGAGTYAFQSTTNGVTLSNIAQIGTNTLLGNATSGTANIAALSMPSCSTAGSALLWTTNSGFSCNTSITANSATTATNATNITTTNDTATNATYYPTFQTATGGTNPLKTSSTKLTFNPSTGVLTATSVATGKAAITGGTLTGVSGTFTSLITTTQSAGDNSTKAASTGYVDRGASGASKVLLSTANASSSSSVTLSGLNSTYDVYEIELVNVKTTATSTNLQAQVVIGGSTKSDAYYRYTVVETYVDGSSSGYSGCAGATSTSIALHCWTSNAIESGVSGTLKIWNPSSTATGNYKFITFDGTFNSYDRFAVGGSYRGTGGDSSATTAIVFSADGTTIASGTFYLYGIRKQ